VERLVADATEQVSSTSGEHAIVIALQEEARGLLDDLATVATDHVDGIGEPEAHEPLGDLVPDVDAVGSGIGGRE
jgi:hypothetical protein